MKRIANKNDIIRLNNYPQKVIDTLYKIIYLLDENYQEDRNIDEDLGGYIVIVENIMDIKILKQDKLQGLVPEYTDVIKCKEGVNWASSLFLLSNDYSVVVMCTEELSKFLLE